MISKIVKKLTEKKTVEQKMAEMEAKYGAWEPTPEPVAETKPSVMSCFRDEKWDSNANVARAIINGYTVDDVLPFIKAGLSTTSKKYACKATFTNVTAIFEMAGIDSFVIESLSEVQKHQIITLFNKNKGVFQRGALTAKLSDVVNGGGHAYDKFRRDDVDAWCGVASTIDY